MHAHTSATDGLLEHRVRRDDRARRRQRSRRARRLKKRFDDGAAIGPQRHALGLHRGAQREGGRVSKVTAETADEAKAAVEFYAKRGYEGIKIYNSVPPELVPVLTEEAHARGMLVTGHIPVHMLANEAVRAGYDGIEHINMLFLNFFATHETDTRDTTRFTLVGDKARDFDLEEQAGRSEFLELLKQHKTVIDPTLALRGPVRRRARAR